MRDVNYGWLLRYLHANGASMFFLAGYIHMFRGMYYGSYKEPREVLWILGVILLLLMIMTGFMGYVLPWGQMSFWAATVITNLFSAIPIVGESDRHLAVGRLCGRQSDAQPLLLAALPAAVRDRGRGGAAHLGAARGRAEQPGPASSRSQDQDTVAFTPYATIKDGFFLVVFLILFAWFVFYVPNYLGHPDNYIPANPSVTPTHIVPEWYYLPFYAILRAIPNKLGGVALLGASIVILAFLPWLDTSKVRSARYRPRYRLFFWLFVICCVGLGWLGSKPAEGIYVYAARVLDRLLLPALPDRPAAARHATRRRSRCRARSPKSVLQGRGRRGCAVMAFAADAHGPRRLVVARQASRRHAERRRSRSGRSRAVRQVRSRRSCSAGSRSTARSARPVTA